MPAEPARNLPASEKLAAQLRVIYDVGAIHLVNASVRLMRMLDERPDVVDEDLALVTEARRDVERAKIVLEGLARRWTS